MSAVVLSSTASLLTPDNFLIEHKTFLNEIIQFGDPGSELRSGIPVVYTEPLKKDYQGTYVTAVTEDVAGVPVILEPRYRALTAEG